MGGKSGRVEAVADRSARRSARPPRQLRSISAQPSPSRRRCLARSSTTAMGGLHGAMDAARQLRYRRRAVASAALPAVGDAGVHLHRARHEISAETPDPIHAQPLDTAIGSAPMPVNRLAFARGGPHHRFVHPVVAEPESGGRDQDHLDSYLKPGDGMSIAHDVHLPSE